MFSLDALWGGHTGRLALRHDAQALDSSPDHPARLKWKIGCEAGLLAELPAWRLALAAPSRRIQAVAWQSDKPFTVAGAARSTALPLPASAWAEEPPKVQGYAVRRRVNVGKPRSILPTAL